MCVSVAALSKFIGMRQEDDKLIQSASRAIHVAWT